MADDKDEPEGGNGVADGGAPVDGSDAPSAVAVPVAVPCRAAVEAGAAVDAGEVPTGGKLREMGARAEAMAEAFATVDEIATVLGLSAEKVVELFGDRVRRGRVGALTKVRLAQLQLAMKGNAPMLIWLGKQYLGQRDVKAESAETRAMGTGPAGTRLVGMHRTGSSLEIERTVRVGIDFEDARQLDARELIRLHREALDASSQIEREP